MTSEFGRRLARADLLVGLMAVALRVGRYATAGGIPKTLIAATRDLFRDKWVNDLLDQGLRLAGLPEGVNVRQATAGPLVARSGCSTMSGQMSGVRGEADILCST